MNRFSIIDVRLDPTEGSEVNKTRPCIIVSPDEMNLNLDTVIIVPITSKKRNLPTRVKIKKSAGLDTDSYAMIDQIRTISKKRIITEKGRLSDKVGDEILLVISEMFS